jgi:uncharacterized protein DUF6159
MADEGRIRRSWRLTGIAWDLVRRDQTMQILALLGTMFAAVAGATVLYLGGYLHTSDYSRGHLALIGLIALYPSTLVSVFFNVALASAAGAALEGRNIGLREALSRSVARLPQIVLWSLLSASVGLLLNQIASRVPGGGRIATWIAGAAWSLATIFVVPILALEGIGTSWAVRKSIRLFRQRWGEGISGSVTIGAWVALAAVPICMAAGVGVALVDDNPTAAAIIIGTCVIGFVVLSALAGAVREVFGVALYRYATGGATGAFPTEDLEHPFLQRRPLSQSRIWGWLAVVITSIVLIGVVGAGVAPRDDRGDSTSGPPTTYGAVFPLADRPLLHEGVDVYYGHDAVAHVTGVYERGGRLVVRIEVDREFAPRWQAMDGQLVLIRSRKNESESWLVVHPRRSGKNQLSPPGAG